MIFDEQITSKVCPRCKTEKLFINFGNRKGKKDCWCKVCCSEHQKNYTKNNKEKIALRKKLYNERTVEAIRIRNKNYAALNKSRIQQYQKEVSLKNKENKRLYDKEYNLKNKGIRYNKTKENRNKRKQNDPIYKFKCNVSKQFYQVLIQGVGKNGTTSKKIMESVGYSFDQLRFHIESQFNDGMTWENYGNPKQGKGWHIDHIIPTCAFGFSSYEDEDFKKCWALSNLRPLWAEDNLRKISSDKKLSIRKTYGK